ncbi:hypothetical protein BC937DRAFT_88022 [Endogone sp. FLAS-F59071]|nr:hypothetical protein BC937DRAFT_88022 [Endogone sp. FLAS-F59071]|eukprot:RUS22663.1 hypothetical protein BC937DRAFT_88022 [Endogone sp. FLAS-F59071]
MLSNTMNFEVATALLPPVTAVLLFLYFSYKRNQFHDSLPNEPSAHLFPHAEEHQEPKRDLFYDYYCWVSRASLFPLSMRILLIGFSESLYNILYYRWQRRSKPEDCIRALAAQHLERRQAEGKIKRPFAIVTGGNAGIGYEIARALLFADYHVILACRSQRLAQSAITRLQATTGSDKVEYMNLDLSLFANVREFAGRVAERLKAGGEIDVLIHNAGIMNLPFGLTADGFDTQLQVNALAPHLLTQLLLPHLARSAHILFTTSAVIYATNHIDLSMFTDRARHSGLGNYAAGKACTMVLTREWNRRLTYHPGAVHTNLFNNTPPFHLSLFSSLLTLVLLSPPEGAITALKLVLAELDTEHRGGKYWFNELPRRTPSVSMGAGIRPEEVKQDIVGEWLWREAGRMCGLKEEE